MQRLRIPDDRRPFYLGVANGVLFLAGMAMGDSSTVMAAFVNRLSGSSVLVGLATALPGVGWALPQLFAANWADTQERKMPLYNLGMWGRIASWLLMMASVWWLCPKHPSLALIAFFVFYAGYWLAGGVGGLAFTVIVAKTIRPTNLGSFFGARLFFGGLLSIGAGYLVHQVLRPGAPFPEAYLLLFGLCIITVTVGLVCFSFIREPAGPAQAERAPLGSFIREGLGLVKLDRDFRRLLRVQLVVSAAWMAQPFYTVFCIKRLGALDETVGYFISALMAGQIISNLVWARMSDLRGNRSVIVTSAWLVCAVPGLALTLSLLPIAHDYALLGFYPLFFISGAISSASSIGYTNYMLELAPEERRPIYYGAMNTLVAPISFSTVLGGVLVYALSYRFLFGFAFALSIAGALMARRLREVRKAVDS